MTILDEDPTDPIHLLALSFLPRGETRPTFHRILAEHSRRLRALSERCNSGIARAEDDAFGEWLSDLYLWHQSIVPLGDFLAGFGFVVPADRFAGTSAEQLAYLNEWASLLPSLEAHFAQPSGEPAAPVLH